ncbi:MAG: hypothetical protein DRI34_11040 [Deltaproteobacteria bacterium]|nr:MAG: hypothetical protein DRI34_11040 [Deltaproteobacteria bacterium]
MPLYDFHCRNCDHEFEALWQRGQRAPACPECGRRRTRRLPSAPALRLGTDSAPARIARRARDYLVDGKVSQAARFLDRAAEHVKDDRVKRIRDRVHRARQRKGSKKK